MTATFPSHPLRYEPSVEHREPDETRTASELAETMRSIQETTCRDYGHAVRSVHAKSHGLLEGELQVVDGLSQELAQGLFAKPARYPVVLRLSTNPGDVLDDSVSVPRGLAVKVIGVQGERLPGSEGDMTQDFVMANAPAFAAPNPAAFAKNLKLLAATTDTGQAWKKVLSSALRGAEAAVEAAGAKSAMLTTMGGQPLTHPLGETFYTQVPLRYGDYIAKIAVVPVSPQLRALENAPLKVRGRPNALREAIIAFFRENGGEWEVRVQLRNDPEAMPVEDASVEWPQEKSPYLPVARIRVPPQPAWSEARAREVDDGLSFSPWHGLAAHQPLGAINRARKDAYRMAADFRAVRNGCPVHEPRTWMDLSRRPAEIYGRPGREGQRRAARHGLRSRERRSGMRDTARHAAAGAAAGLVAGLVLSALLLGPEARRGQASELVRLKRRTAAQVGRTDRREEASPTLSEELIAHGGHLALAAMAGAGYGLVRRGSSASPVVAGLIFGTGFYALAYGVIGPAAGVAAPPWRDAPASVAQHGAMHALFGITTGLLTAQFDSQFRT